MRRQINPIAVLALLVSIGGCKPSLTAADQNLTEAIEAGTELAPETIDSGNWSFWCRSGWPDGRSSSDHFVSAFKYAQQNGLAYVGPRLLTSETQSWPLVFVGEDGSTRELFLSEFRFEPDMNGFCARRGEYLFKIEDRKISLRRRGE